MGAARGEVLLARHGETAWNAAGRVQGQADAPLNAEGRRQARALAVAVARGALGPAAVSASASSDLERASETCCALEASLGLPRGPRVPELRERHLGPLQGLTWAEARATEPEAFAAAQGEGDARIPGGGESFGDVKARLKAAVEALVAARPGERILLCTHGGVIMAAYALAGQRRRKIPANASVSIFSVDASAGTWAFKGYRGDLLDQARPPGEADAAAPGEPEGGDVFSTQ